MLKNLKRPGISGVLLAPARWNRVGAAFVLALGVAGLRCESTGLPEAGTEGRQVVIDGIGMERSSEADTLLLRNGETLAGEVLTESFDLQAFYGQVRLDKTMIAGIHFDGGNNQLSTVVTINRNQFSGFIGNPEIRLRDETGAEIQVRREKVLKAAFRIRDRETDEVSQGRILLLRNGDIASGTLEGNVSIVSTDGETIPMSPGAVDAIFFHGQSSRSVSVRKPAGVEVRGLLNREDLVFELDVGTRLAVYTGHLEGIYSRAAFKSRAKIGLDGVPASSAVVGNGPGPARDGMAWISPGRFNMGSSSEERDRGLDEGPQAEVVIPKGFWMGKCEVTQGEYMAVMGGNPSHYAGDLNHPVEKVSWQEAMEYCSLLTAKEEAAGTLPEGFFYRLPTEAEWEYACRAGTDTRFSFGDDPDYARLSAYAWFNVNSSSSTHPIGMKKANPWGLHDMHGNVWEWCLDHWNGSGTENGSFSSSDTRGSLRGARGGSWLYEGRFCRSANRDSYFPTNRCSDLGFRVVLAPIER